MQLLTDLVGRTLAGRYTVLSRLDGGRLGDVYRARDQLLVRPVALKVLNPALATDEEVVQRFRDETCAVARLSHPNAVEVYDWGGDAGTFFMVMEDVPGTDLRDVLVARGSIQPAQAAEIMAQVCDALHAAHVRGLVHRDLKPENIFITPEGSVKVADFGIAAVTARERVTSNGMATELRYISPEQALGFEASATSDIWAAGAILGEMLTGRLPLQGAGQDLVAKRAHEEPEPPSRWQPKIPKDLDHIVVKACALDPAKRFYDASDMSQTIRRVAVRSLPSAPPVQSLVEGISVGSDIDVADPGPFVHERSMGRHGKPRLRLRLGRIFMLLGLLAAFVAGTWLLVGEVTAPRELEVPKLVGMTSAEADAEVDDLGIEVVGRRVDLKAPAGTIVDQEPAEGTMQEGSALEVTVSDGPPSVHVPMVVGSSRGAARARLRSNGLGVGKVFQRHAFRSPGTVIKQLPDRRELTWGSKVHLVLSKGPPPVDVPKVAGRTKADAVKRMQRANLKPKVVHVYSDSVGQGLVVYTQPKENRTVRSRDVVKLFVSLGPELRSVSLPDVSGMSLDAAASELAAFGLETRTFATCKKPRRVKATDPSAGSTVTEGDTITLVAC